MQKYIIEHYFYYLQMNNNFFLFMNNKIGDLSLGQETLVLGAVQTKQIDGCWHKEFTMQKGGNWPGIETDWRVQGGSEITWFNMLAAATTASNQPYQVFVGITAKDNFRDGFAEPDQIHSSGTMMLS